jgi:hypothetical protein
MCRTSTVPAIKAPLLEAEEDSLVTVAASGYSPPTPAPRQNLYRCITHRKQSSKNQIRHHMEDSSACSFMTDETTCKVSFCAKLCIQTYLQHANWPYTVKCEELPHSALPKEPIEISTAVATNSFLRPMTSANPPVVAVPEMQRYA